ncbi:hypothetical protein N7E02_14395 [Aliirhizobium terrae]|uniref:hypothetical protein n=1 Tax=Terrirhizobium terrae TaxID=2926709 RepID=UPI00257537E4|nr:hypothetical protein [Rhizobium sp. CC-CFT758]WJH42388.1 hypothetical protein N7E02_14395 [Rhizobium sp. CC-CFT758]
MKVISLIAPVTRGLISAVWKATARPGRTFVIGRSAFFMTTTLTGEAGFCWPAAFPPPAAFCWPESLQADNAVARRRVRTNWRRIMVFPGDELRSPPGLKRVAAAKLTRRMRAELGQRRK